MVFLLLGMRNPPALTRCSSVGRSWLGASRMPKRAAALGEFLVIVEAPSCDFRTGELGLDSLLRESRSSLLVTGRVVAVYSEREGVYHDAATLKRFVHHLEYLACVATGPSTPPRPARSRRRPGRRAPALRLGNEPPEVGYADVVGGVTNRTYVVNVQPVTQKNHMCVTTAVRGWLVSLFPPVYMYLFSPATLAPRLMIFDLFPRFFSLNYSFYLLSAYVL